MVNKSLRLDVSGLARTIAALRVPKRYAQWPVPLDVAILTDVYKTREASHAVSGAAHAESEAEECAQCGLRKFEGATDPATGEFYCQECWDEYEHEGDGNYDATMDPGPEEEPGVVEVELTAPLGLKFDGDSQHGYYITLVKDGGSAKMSGMLREGLRFLRVNTVPVLEMQNKKELTALIKASGGGFVQLALQEDDEGYAAYNKSKSKVSRRQSIALNPSESSGRGPVWLHRKIKQAEAEQLLTSHHGGRDGTFLVFERKPNEYALSLRFTGKNTHHKVSRSVDGAAWTINDTHTTEQTELVDLIHAMRNQQYPRGTELPLPACPATRRALLDRLTSSRAALWPFLCVPAPIYASPG